MDPVTAAIVGEVTKQTTESLIKLCWNHISYVIHCHKKTKCLQEELEKLGHLRSEVVHKVNTARDNGYIVKEYVKQWLTKAHGMEIEVEEILKCKAGENKGWFTPTVCSKYRLGKEAKKKTISVLGLKEDGKFTEVAHPPPLPNFEASCSNDYDHFDSRAHVFQDIMELLKGDNNIKMIGVYGMGGVGKTAIVREVGKQAEKDELFDDVVFTTISQTLNVINVQSTLAEQLGLTLKKVSEIGRAGELCNRLKNGKKTLVIFDDVWNKINLKEIGIPLGADVTSCKIVLTTRKRDVCYQMKVQRDFAIGVLSEAEAWTLFKTKVGNSKLSSPEMCSIAGDVCRECGGLPLALLAVGAVLMNYKDKHVWDDVLEQLRNSRLNNIEGLGVDVYSRLELSYNYLEQTDAKSCFLLCCLFSEDAEISIEELVAYGMGRRLFQYVGTIEKARNRVRTMVDILKSSCLLLEGREGNVKMHDVVRDVAISIASKSEQACLVETGIEEWPHIDTYEHYTAISLWSMYIQMFPDYLECPNLRVLVLECYYFYETEIPLSFFNGMKNLEVLVLRNISISSSKSSISCLVNLRMLCLYHCNLVDISFLKELRKLENLDLDGSCINEFGPEIGELTRLRRLDLRTHVKLGIIPTHIISSLSGLEELYIDNMDADSEVELEELYIDNMYADSEVELEATDKERCNTSLSAPFPKDTLFEKLTRFEVYIGGSDNCFLDHDSTLQRTLLIFGSPLEHWVEVLLLKAEAVSLKRLHDCDQKWECFSKLSKLINITECGLKQLYSLSIARGFVQLESLEISKCESIDRIIGNEAVGLQATFPRLRRINFSDLPNLISFCPQMKYMSTPEQNQSILVQPLFNEKVAIPALEELRISMLNVKDIWDKKLSENSFCHLKLLNVVACHNMVSLIPFNMLQRLQNLEEIDICDCDQMTCEWLKDEEKNEAENIELPSVKKIKLWCLPNLTQTGLNSGILAYINLRILSIYKCGSLRNVFSASTVRSLVHLKQLIVDSCKKMEEIVTIEEEGAEKIVFHQLEILKLQDLPSLRCFCSSGFDDVGVVAGENVNVPKQEALFSDQVAIPALKYLWIKDLNVKDIWDKKLPEDSFCHLKLLYVTRCHNMVSLIPFNMLQRLQNLKKLTVESCEKMEEIVTIEEEGAEKIIFHQLEILTLVDLPTLRCFCSSGFDNVGVVAGENVNVPKQEALFSDQVAFPCLTKLGILGISKLREKLVDVDSSKLRARFPTLREYEIEGDFSFFR